ncbi:MAG: hypothetical protein R3E10_03605 [Gemmatimonadota bacterium]
MEDLIPILLLVAWFLGALGNQRKRKERAARRNAPGPSDVRREQGPQSGDVAQARPRRARDLIPKDLWEEIEALAQGRPPRPVPTPAPEPQAQTPQRRPTGSDGARPRVAVPPARARRPSPAPRPLPPPDALPEAVSLERLEPRPLPVAGERSASGLSAAPTLRRPTPASRRRPARALGLEDPAAARKAMILREVLGPPLSLRE